MHVRYVILVNLVMLAWASASSPAAEPSSDLTAELSLRAAGLSTDGPALLDFFRKRMQTEVQPDQLQALVRQLGDPTPALREKAQAELVSRGTVAIPFLRQALKDPDDVAVAQQARRCLQLIESTPPPPTQLAGPSPYQSAYPVAPGYPGSHPGAAPGAATPPSLPIAAARLLALRQPPEAVEVLLAYLPFADDSAVLDEVRTTLASLALKDGRPDTALVRGLENPVALRRVTAAEVLCQVARAEPRDAIRKLLRDAKPMVRLRVALTLADLMEADAVDVLIALLTELPASENGLAEDYLLTLAADQAPQVTADMEAASRQKARDAWAAWWKAQEGAALLKEISRRTLADADRAKAQTLIKQLGDDQFQVREQATKELQAMGPAIVPLLRQAAVSSDLEVGSRAQKLLAVLDKEKTAPLSAVTVRLLAYRKPAGAAEVLLGYLPLAEDETVTAEVRTALAAVAAPDSKPEPSVLKALDDSLPLRRAAAAEALCRAGPASLRPAIRKLLQDRDSSVRQQVALALAESGDREAVPALIASLGQLTPEQQFQAEEFLSRVAGDRAPATRPGSDATSRNKARDAWTAWWQQHGPTVSDARLASARLDQQRQLGYTLLISLDQGQVQELGRDGKLRWQLNGLQGPVDAQVLPNLRVLVAEQQGQRISERNLMNEILWQKQVNWPLGCQRLANGHTFIVLRNQLLEVDRDGKEVFTYNRPNHDLMAAQKLRDGRIVCMTHNGVCLWLDASGKEVKSFRVTGNFHQGNIDVLPNGRVLVPHTWNNKVIEYDIDGKAVWQANVQQPTSAVRLSNGHTLIASQGWPAKLLELDRTGKVVWENQPASRPSRVKRR
jgi:HEAT repeat protein